MYAGDYDLFLSQKAKPMNALINRIRHYSTTESEDFEGLAKLPHRLEVYEPHADIVVEGDKIDHVFIVEDGWAIRFRILDDGRRQIVNFMLPGDCFDLMSLNGAKSDHNVAAATKVTLRKIKSKDFLSAISENLRLSTSFWWAAVQEEGILREQIVRVGRRSAKERVGHMILELNRRVAATSGQIDNYLPLPVPQSMLADALGLSDVHISRTLSFLRTFGYIRNSRHGIEILDREGLAEMSDFDSRYLHFEKLAIDVN